MNLLDRIKSYAIVSPFGYLCTALWTDMLVRDLSKIADGQGSTGKVILDIAGLLVIGVGISYKNISTYRRMRDRFEERGYSERFAKPKMYSWGDRNSVRTAASETGHLEEYLEQCEKEGHKWYHFLPKVHRYNEIKPMRKA